jgi:hypothetical protein
MWVVMSISAVEMSVEEILVVETLGLIRFLLGTDPVGIIPAGIIPAGIIPAGVGVEVARDGLAIGTTTALITITIGTMDAGIKDFGAPAGTSL